VRQIDQCYPQLHQESRLPAPSATIGASVEELDIEAVVKASQVLSGEMDLPHLIEKLMRIAVEHAAADRAVLIHVQEGEPQVEAEAVTGRDAVTVRLRQRSAMSTEFPESMLRYVIRSQDSVILEDALTPSRFSADDYLRREVPRSVLCLPLVKQTQLTGILYLENRLTPQVFTPARLTVLRLLASQAAISLENARLYADLQQEIVERKDAEEEMQWQKAHLDELFELAPEAIVLSNINAQVIRVNREFTNLFGYTPEEAVGRAIAISPPVKKLRMRCGAARHFWRRVRESVAPEVGNGTFQRETLSGRRKAIASSALVQMRCFPLSSCSSRGCISTIASTYSGC
jgi:PAS domain-containing protein